ncbi:3-deoxy-7-phosphoheptulonate synthase [Burkholderia ubonensis]|uniref:3-deoxy-7-phosphoheptulonate synthase n=1 Tax=Burkholderia ubonensis TaxID=101571 RepID=UPI00075D900C|nr:3-deoxy-7-phosphoheptulonate synthase [Burkholderia ubonensis]KUZ75929.1 phospho-2-dehydro-3-deoxyheptonate aldolase [Burkholderia ubonensis]
MNELFDGRNLVKTPALLKGELPATPKDERFVSDSRAAVRRILDGSDDRLLVIVGPCSIHDPAAALDYAARLSQTRQALLQDLEIVMRVYYEKPRSRLGWKGLVNDPRLDETYDIDVGLQVARKLLLDVTSLALPIATEFLSTCSPHYLADLISWGAIGARTTESQVHREMASGLPCPIGFKNSTDGALEIAIDAIRSARAPHCFLGVDDNGRFIRQQTDGNRDGHLVLRGGKVPNFDAPSVTFACDRLAANALPPHVVIDASHGNSGKLHENQLRVCASIGAQVAAGNVHIAGLMIESNLVAGAQVVSADRALVYGQSITDACIGWNDTVDVLNRLASAVRTRRQATNASAGQVLQPAVA